MGAAWLLAGLLASTSTFEDAMAASRQALAKKVFKEAERGCRQAVRLSGEARTGGPRAAAAEALCGRVQDAQRRHLKAARHYRAALLLEPINARMRQRWGERWVRALGRARKPTQAPRRFLAEDKVISRFARRKAASAEELELLSQATRMVGEAGDRRRRAFAYGVAAKLRLQQGEVEKALALARKASGADHVEVKRMGLKTAARAHLESEAYLAAATVAARLALLPDPNREDEPALLRLGPTGQTACRGYDAEAGPGACARALRRKFRRFVVSDRGQGRRVSARSPQDLDETHAEATVFLQDCLQRLARRAPERLSGERLELSWVVDGEGRAIEPSLRPRRLSDLLTGCLSERLTWLRYPRLRQGEHQNVTISFQLGDSQR